jgi:hypothetical protein
MHSKRILLLLLFPGLVVAQGNERSASRELLDRARVALNDLDYVRADNMARGVLTLGLLNRPARIEALQIIAAANYPDTPNERKEAAARGALAQLIQIDLAIGVAREFASPGIDSLYQSVLGTTFGTTVLVRPENSITGVAGVSPLRVRANRPATIAVSLRTKDGIESFLLDSVASGVDTTLNLRVGRNGRPYVAGGQYELVVTATELATRQTSVKVFDAVALVPAIDYVVVPTVIDSSLLKPERSRPERSAGIIAGAFIGAATIVAGRALRAPESLRSAGETDKRYVTVGTLLAVGTGVAAWFDRGRVLDKSILSNQRALADLTVRQRAAREENARRAADYRASITVTPEAK